MNRPGVCGGLVSITGIGLMDPARGLMGVMVVAVGESLDAVEGMPDSVNGQISVGIDPHTGTAANNAPGDPQPVRIDIIYLITIINGLIGPSLPHSVFAGCCHWASTNELGDVQAYTMVGCE